MELWDEATNLWLFTPGEYEQLPDGIELESINGHKAIKGKHYIGLDVAFGHIAWGVRNPLEHPEGPLFTKFKLS